MKNKLIVFLLASVFLASCAMNHLEKNLDPDSKEFLSVVRYLITKQERKIFLNLLPEERDNFKEEFWKKRDPDPGTEENEFKIQYFKRIEEANVLFRQGTTPGWLQDRGRVYITLGPPDERRTYPRGQYNEGFPTEIWLYNFFPIVFVDENWTGNYRMTALSAQQINEINRAQIAYRPKVPGRKVDFDFDVSLKAKQAEGAVFQIEIPYNNIWFKEVESISQTTFEVSLKLMDGKEAIWEHEDDYEVSVPTDELEDYIDDIFVIEITAEVKPGSYELDVVIVNKTGGERMTKRINVTI